MAWQKLADRINSLPLVLCGPLVRRVDSTSTTVWIALKEPRKVTLRVYQMASDLSGRVQVQEGTRSTVKLGQYLHVVAVTAAGNMGWGRLYVYDLRFGQAGNDTAPVPETGIGLFNNDILAKTPSDARKLILYEPSELGPNMGPLDLPSFATPPTDLNQIRLIHGSCRKPHGHSKDALQILDLLIKDSLSDPLRRPHQLFLTGDQIYADDVADGLLAMLTDAGDVLLGWTEALPTKDGPKKPAELLFGRRQTIVEKSACFSSGEAKSHLLSLGEFYAMYLFAWATVLWPPEVPDFANLYPQEWQEYQDDLGKGERGHILRHHLEIVEYKSELRRLETFKLALPMVRRALANIPSFMIFDDHEITDDWYFERKWCEDVLATPLGQRIIGNGLLAYALFQAWGNTPAQFAIEGADSAPGSKLLAAASQWDGTEGHAALAEIQKRIGLNQSTEIRTNRKLVHPSGSLDWHYHLPAVPNGPPYEVIVLDSRTWRGFPGGPKDAAALISDETVLDTQLARGTSPPVDGVTIVIAPAPVIGVPLVEEFVQTTLVELKIQNRRSVDRETWGYQRNTLELLLGRLVERSTRVVFLSGDVHYGFSARLGYQALRPYGAPPPSMTVMHRTIMAQLTSSSLKNESSSPPTYFLHDHGYIPFLHGLPRYRRLAGWHVAPEVTRKRIHGDREVRESLSIRSNPPLFNIDYPDDCYVNVQPDWQYRIDFLIAEPRNATPAQIPMPSSWKIEPYLEAQKAYRKYPEEYAPGKEIVGLNNLGEITLIWKTGDDRSVTHQLWWWLSPTSQPFPSSKYVISLRLSDPDYPHRFPLPES